MFNKVFKRKKKQGPILTKKQGEVMKKNIDMALMAMSASFKVQAERNAKLVHDGMLRAFEDMMNKGFGKGL